MDLQKKFKKIVSGINDFKSKQNPAMSASAPFPRWLFYPLIVLISSTFDIWFVQFQIQVGMNQTLVERVQAATNFVVNAFIPGSQNHQFILNLIFVLAFFGLILAITNRFWLTFILNNLIFIVFAIADNQKLIYRNESILPSDLSQLTNPLTLVNFIGISAGKFVMLVVLAILVIVILYFLFRRFDSRIKFTKWFVRVPLFVLSALIIFSARNLYTSNTLPDRVASRLNDSPIPWDVNYDQRSNGAIYSFMRFFDNKVMNMPQGYSRAAMAKIDRKYKKVANQINANRPNYLDKQTVIYILSESFSDPLRVPGLHVNPDPIPKIRAIKDRTTSGYMLSSGYGGGTANLEYQALTGLSLTNFLPTVTSPYVQVVPSSNYLPNISNNWAIKNAIHPYLPMVYDRSSVYKKFGFQKFYTLYNPKIKYQDRIDNNPYVSDRAAYQNVLWQLSKNAKPQFIQMPTMQNHLGYSNWYKNYTFDITSTLQQSNSEVDNVKTYVQGVNMTDNATEWFLQQLDRINRPITVVWYGDHLPGIYDSEMSDPNNLLPLHETDYFIYSNKASSSHNTKLEDQNNFTSPNYFQALSAEHMNVKVSPFLAMLTELRQQLPASSNALAKSGSDIWQTDNRKNIYLDDQGQQLQNNQFSPAQRSLLRDYRMIQYDIVKGRHYIKNDGFLNNPK
ncbi:MAG: sulfatase-like hydrolase/transferase [Oenococcus sp.]|uniref:sulfatase-like hydrolase/transferase n=1 Tax=Oenococcus sp. TaxID=1979414 RepID=UPI0039E7A876